MAENNHIEVINEVYNSHLFATLEQKSYNNNVINKFNEKLKRNCKCKVNDAKGHEINSPAMVSVLVGKHQTGSGLDYLTCRSFKIRMSRLLTSKESLNFLKETIPQTHISKYTCTASNIP